ncbi:MAG: hypothetical protein J5525_12550 [Lachnospiraceae bacterium]|nr:hypothetical protein [Lachnospiraceae bacterium]
MIKMFRCNVLSDANINIELKKRNIKDEQVINICQDHGTAMGTVYYREDSADINTDKE